ncbi:hypothetical protein NMB1503 [Neisseria meningitidis MC58]|uniref:Uncharacterized protein n=1 Tax=Neisseria meningitidis serogroup B (strain ATCC BAA-335 / MC58) TaxID=122586 RepID=Q9JYN1_NEIMB|nr:hypothetical protein NMB1503 [Neisseria meningitidis MC58]
MPSEHLPDHIIRECRQIVFFCKLILKSTYRFTPCRPSLPHLHHPSTLSHGYSANPLPICPRICLFRPMH